RRHTRSKRDWSSDVCSSDLTMYHRLLDLPRQLGDTPTVLIDAEDLSGRLPWVVPDEVGGAERAVQEPLDHGHRRIGFVTNVEDVPEPHGRLAGSRKNLEAASIANCVPIIIARTPET